MIRIAEVLALVPKITPVEARMTLLASSTSEADSLYTSLYLAGQVTGPLCEYATTLRARIPLQSIGIDTENLLRAEARILEPCFWEPQHPFCYEVQLELHGNAGLLDMRRIISGIRHLEMDGDELLLNGQPFFVQGVKHFTGTSITELEAWHAADCNAFLTDASTGLCDRTDRWGPMVLHILVPQHNGEATRQVTQLRNHPSLLMWVLPPGIVGEALDLLVQLIRGLDPSRPIGRLVKWDETAHDSFGTVDVLLLPIGHPGIGNLAPAKPYIVVGPAPAKSPGCAPETFAEQVAAFRDSVGSPPGLVGIML
jgi:hypothetical protein